MTPFVRSNINQLKEAAVKVQDYEFASNVRSLERNDAELPDAEIEKQLMVMITEFNEKHKVKNSRIGDTIILPSDMSLSFNVLMKDANALRQESAILLRQANEIAESAWEIVRKKYPEFTEKTGLAFIKDTDTVIVIQDSEYKK